MFFNEWLYTHPFYLRRAMDSKTLFCTELISEKFPLTKSFQNIDHDASSTSKRFIDYVAKKVKRFYIMLGFISCFYYVSNYLLYLGVIVKSQNSVCLRMKCIIQY